MRLVCDRTHPFDRIGARRTPFVQFQLGAQRIQLDRFVCMAGCGKCDPWYIGEARIYTDHGGYEQP